MTGYTDPQTALATAASETRAASPNRSGQVVNGCVIAPRTQSRGAYPSDADPRAAFIAGTFTPHGQQASASRSTPASDGRDWTAGSRRSKAEYAP